MSPFPTTKLRRNRLLGDGERSMLAKIPRNVAENERNCVLGMGSTVHAGAASGQVLTVTASRPLFLRDLVIAAGTVRGRVRSIKVEGDELVQGKSVPFEAFGINNRDRPEFDLPVAGGTTVEITYDVDAAATVEASWNID